MMRKEPHRPAQTSGIFRPAGASRSAGIQSPVRKAGENGESVGA